MTSLIPCGIKTPVPLCPSTFTRLSDLKRHQRTVNKHFQVEQLECIYCKRKLHHRGNFNQHVRTCSRRRQEEPAQIETRRGGAVSQTNQQGAGAAGQEAREPEPRGACDEVSVLDDYVKVLKMHPRMRETHDLSLFLEGKTSSVLKNLKRELNDRRGIKWYVCVKVRMVKHKHEGVDDFTEPHFRSLTIRTTNVHELEEQVYTAKEKIKSSFIEYMREGSRWQFDEVLHLDLNLAT